MEAIIGRVGGEPQSPSSGRVVGDPQAPSSLGDPQALGPQSRSGVESRDLPTSRRRLAVYLFAAAGVLAAANDVAEAARRLLALMGEAEGFCAGAVWLASDDGSHLACAEVWCPPERPAPEFERACREGSITRGLGLAGRVWASGRSIVVTDVGRDPDVRRDPRVEREIFRAVVCVPIATGTDVTGVIELFGTAPRAPDPMLGEVLASVAGQLAEFVRRTAAEKALARAQQRLRTVVGNAPIILFGFDREGRLTLGEGGGLAAAGLRMDELAGRSIFDVSTDSPVLIDHAHRALSGESFTATVHISNDKSVSRLADVDREADGGRVYEIRYNPIFDTDGSVAEVIGVATDITDRTNAERALRRSEAQLLEADRLASLGALAAGVAHEINNPLAYVLLNLDHVIETLEGRDPTAAAEPCGELSARLHEARAGVERVRLIAQDLKAFSRIDSERRVPIDVRRVLDSSIDIASSEIRHRARLVRNYAEVPLVEADPSRLGQVFLNLLVNAAQAMDVGGAARHEIRVSTGVRAGSDPSAPPRVVVSIADTGAGIPPSVRERIFEPFFTTKPPGVGTGLGLAIGRTIVASLGGEIVVESDVGKGSVFHVLLPAASTASEGQGAPPPPSRSDAPSRPPDPAPTKRARVLIVDDEPVLATALGRSIQPEYEVVVLSGGREALELLRTDDRFQVILCDLIMPGVTGMDFYEELARTKPALAARVIFMTGGTFTPRTREFLANVENPTLDKPFDLAALHALLRLRARSP